jgi:8-oxo-dGTP pyrophosphatase MutT (NUDIX family)
MSSLPTAASSGILERDGRFLLVLRRNPPSADMYAFPGGRAEAGETPDDTALREFEEETGIKARNPRIFATYDLKQHDADGQLEQPFPSFGLSAWRRTWRRLPSLPTTRRISDGSRSRKFAGCQRRRACSNAPNGLRAAKNKQGEMQRRTLFPSPSGYPIPQ